MHKNFLITLNNPDVTPKQFLHEVQQIGFTYGRCQLERGQEGTEHLQGVFGGKRSRFDAIKRAFPRAHIEVAKHPRAAWRYCGKEETRIGECSEFGTPPFLSNSKVDQAEKNAIILEKGPEEAVTCGLISIGDYQRYKRACELFKNQQSTLQPRDELDNEWVYGPPGTGKSKYARQSQPAPFIKPLNKWWDGYGGQPCVVLDDFELDQKCLGHYLKIWADHYPFRAESKGGVMYIRPSKIIVTSNYHPRDIWTEPMMVAAIERRFNIINFN